MTIDPGGLPPALTPLLDAFAQAGYPRAVALDKAERLLANYGGLVTPEFQAALQAKIRELLDPGILQRAEALLVSEIVALIVNRKSDIGPSDPVNLA